MLRFSSLLISFTDQWCESRWCPRTWLQHSVLGISVPNQASWCNFFTGMTGLCIIQDCVLFPFTIHMLDCFVREAKDEVKPHISCSGGGEIQEGRKTITELRRSCCRVLIAYHNWFKRIITGTWVTVRIQSAMLYKQFMSTFLHIDVCSVHCTESHFTCCQQKSMAVNIFFSAV